MRNGRIGVAAALLFASLWSVIAHAAPDHVVIVVEENKSFRQIIGSPDAPYINALARKGALFTQSFAVAHPSQPNYLALFAGSTFGVADDRCPLERSDANLASELARKGLTFRIFSESLPSIGYAGCIHGAYFRKHNPAVNWQGSNVTAEMNAPFSAFPRDYSKLPTVAFVVPNQLNDMHDGTAAIAIRRGDAWLKENIGPYVQWAEKHNSLLILTWDEDDDSSNNHIATIFIGPMVRSGSVGTRIDHYGVLRTLTDLYGLRPLGKSAERTPVAGIWAP